VLGDNRDGSADSRFHTDLPSKGFVSKDVVVGRAFLVTWPFSHFTWLDNYPDVFKNIPKP
jgi:signal peptidase I